MSALSTLTSQRNINEILERMDLLCEETRGKNNIDPNLANRIRSIGVAIQRIIFRYEKFPLLKGVMDKHADVLWSESSKLPTIAELPRMRRIFRVLTQVNVDSALAKTFVEGNGPSIIQKIETFLNENPLGDSRRIFIRDIVDQLINQDKLKEAIDVDHALQKVDKNIFYSIIEQIIGAQVPPASNRLIEAIPLLFKKCTDEASKIQKAKKIIVEYSNIYLSSSNPTPSPSLLLQTLLDEGIDPSSGIKWCFLSSKERNKKISEFYGLITPENGLPILIYNGADVNKLKEDMNKSWVRTDQLLPDMDKALQIYQEVCQQHHQLSSTTLFQQLEKEEALENIPKDLKRIIVSYDRKTIVELCLAKGFPDNIFYCFRNLK